ncbi:MAG: hypothetical protein RL557_4 [archaeon]
MRRVAICIFYTSDKKILLQDRRNISKFGEQWGFFGGSIEEGENPEQAVVREIFEELEYKLINYKFFKKYGAILPSDQESEAYVFVAEFPGFEKLHQHEGDDMKLFSFEEACQKLTEWDHQMPTDVETSLETH